MKNKRVGKLGSFALKLDMSKTYDRVEWTFLRLLLQRMRFFGPWIAMLMKCVETVIFYSDKKGSGGDYFSN